MRVTEPSATTRSLVVDGELAGLGLDLDDAALEVEADRRAEQQVGVRAHRPQRHGDVARLDAAAAASGSSGV